jgi:hypothetical protein
MDAEHLSQLVAQARAHAVEVIAKSGELAEEHARRAEARGDDLLAAHERARAAKAREIVLQARRDVPLRGGAQWMGSGAAKRRDLVRARDRDPRRRDGAAARLQVACGRPPLRRRIGARRSAQAPQPAPIVRW